MRLSKFVAAALLAAPMVASAAPATASFKVSAEVKPTCIVSASDIVVTSYDPNAPAAAVATGAITVTCTKGTKFDAVLTSTSGFKMAGPGADKLAYQIFQGSGTTGTVWASETASNPYTVTAANKKALDLLATVSIDPGQDVMTGSYTDSVTVNVNY